jgi:hypothetical protein
MTAREAEAAAAAAAVDLGMQIAEEYWQAAGANPGNGLQVALPSVTDSQGRPVIGEGYDVSPSAPALRPPTRPALVPDYGAPAVGGAGFHTTQPGTPNGLDGIPAWPSGRSQSSVAYVSPSGSRPARPARATGKAVRARLRSARRDVLGK